MDNIFEIYKIIFDLLAQHPLISSTLTILSTIAFGTKIIKDYNYLAKFRRNTFKSDLQQLKEYLSTEKGISETGRIIASELQENLYFERFFKRSTNLHYRRKVLELYENLQPEVTWRQLISSLSYLKLKEDLNGDMNFSVDYSKSDIIGNHTIFHLGNCFVFLGLAGFGFSTFFLYSFERFILGFAVMSVFCTIGMILWITTKNFFMAQRIEKLMRDKKSPSEHTLTKTNKEKQKLPTKHKVRKVISSLLRKTAKNLSGIAVRIDGDIKKQPKN